jgi:hypothetical protein
VLPEINLGNELYVAKLCFTVDIIQATQFHGLMENKERSKKKDGKKERSKTNQRRNERN